MKLPGWTCPDLDKLARIVRRITDPVAREEALRLLEQIRDDNTRLRAAAGRNHEAP